MSFVSELVPAWDLILGVVAALLISVMLGTGLSFLTTEISDAVTNNKRVDQRRDYSKTVLRALKDGLVLGWHDLQELVATKDGINRVGEDPKQTGSRILGDLYLMIVEEKTPDDLQFTLQESRDFLNRIRALREEAKRADPFEAVPEPVRSRLVSVQVSLDQEEGEDDRLAEIGSIFRDTKEALDKSKTRGRWTMAISVAGVLATLVFGILTVSPNG